MGKIVKEGLNKPINPNLLRDMVSISNNSDMTNLAARILSEKLDENDLRAIQQWISLAKREKTYDTGRNRGFGNPNFKRY